MTTSRVPQDGRMLATITCFVASYYLVENLWELPRHVNDGVLPLVLNLLIVTGLGLLVRDTARMLLRPRQHLPQYTTTDMAAAWDRAHKQAVMHLRLVGHLTAAEALSNQPNPYQETR